MNNYEYFTTPDLALATVISLSYPVDNIETSTGRRVVFVFRRDEGLDQLVEAYWKRETRVEPLQFSEGRKLLISRMENLNG